ncbi:MAG: glycosyl transferase family 1 [Bacteroidetes bacterium]|nr:glycosyltransferase family 4 protein [Bacteroidia bacterium]MBN4052277.1 glycosyltransferase family 4 protein [Sphingobacteriaceae bacterium AH-315-L07]PCH67308.1 MAG: glycosyl transferase family 1 [Bacteroidota bacterium]
MRIKVLVISDYRSVTSSRPEAEVFIRLKKLGVDVEIMTYAGCEYDIKFKEEGIPVTYFHPEKKFDNSEIKRIRDELINGKHQILHLFNSKAIINGIRAAKNIPVKVVLYRGYAGNINWWDPTAYLKFLHSRVDKIVCNSKGVEELIQSQLFFDKRKTITINKGHLLEWYKDIIPIELSELGVPKGAFVVTCVANARSMKGISYLLKAMNDIPQDIPIHLMLVGRGMTTKQNISIVKNSTNKDKIHLIGFRNDSLRIVAASSCFVMVSIKGESITKAVMEAMALGIAPIITDIPGNRELVIDNESGLVVPSRNSKEITEAILKLYNDRELCNKLGESARNRIDTRFNNNYTATKTKEMYEELVSTMD